MAFNRLVNIIYTCTATFYPFAPRTWTFLSWSDLLQQQAAPITFITT